MAISNKTFMGGGLNDTANATLDKFVPEIWGASIMDYMEKNLVFGSLANDLSAMVAGGGDVIHLPKHEELTAETLYGATADHDAQISGIGFNTQGTTGTEYQLVVDQSSYSALAISDIAQAQSSYDVMNLYTEKLGYALAKKVDFYLAQKLYQAVTHNDGGNNNAEGDSKNYVVFTSSDSYNIQKEGVANMIQAIYEADSNIEDFVMVLTPAAYGSLFKLAEFAKYDGTGLAGDSNPLINGFAGKLGGVDVIVSNNIVHAPEASGYVQSVAPKLNITDVTNETSELSGYLIHKDAMHIAYANGMKARVQSDYHLPTLATRFVADSVYGCLITSNESTNKKLFALVDGIS